MSDYEVIRPRSRSRIARWLDSVRSITLGPWNPRDKEIARYFEGGSTLSGVSVNEETALAVSAVWSAVTMISDDISSLPLMLYRKLPEGGKKKLENHPLYWLLHDQPNPEMDSMVFRRVMQGHALLWQNAYAEIERDGAGRPRAIWPLVPESVWPEREFGQTGPVVYRVRNASGRDVFIPAKDMIHLVGFSHNGLMGDSLVQKARESLGLSLAAEKYGASYFGNGASVGGVISMTGPRPDERVAKGYREQLEARHQGVERAHKFLMLYNDAKYTQNVIPPNAGQFNETRIQQIREVARWFKIPPHKLGDLADATYSNVEQMDAVYLSSCIRPWLTLWNQQLTHKLVAPLEQGIQFVEHETHGFLSVDAASRAQLYSSEFGIGSIQINEIRGYENRNPVAGGDTSFVPLQLIPLDLAQEYWAASIESMKAKAEADRRPPPPPPTDTGEKDRQIAKLTEELALARRNAQSLEDRLEMAHAALTDVQAQRMALETRLEDRGEELAGVIRARNELQASHNGLSDEVADLRGRLDGMTVARDATQRALERAEIERDGHLAGREHDQTQHATALAEAAAERDRLVAQTEGLSMDVVTLTKELDAERKRVLEVEAVRADVVEECQVLGRHLTAAVDDYNTEKQRADTLVEQVAELTGRLDATETRLVDAVADRDALENALTDARNDLVTITAAEHSALTERDMLSADIDTLQQQLAGAELALETERALVRTKRGIAQLALRGLLVDTFERVLQREVDRARKHQATPEKLRTWIDNFYPMQANTLRNDLKPIVHLLVGLDVMGTDDSEALLDRLVTQHIEMSTTTLRQIADVDDPDGMASALDRALRRWETERSHTVAEAILKQGMTR